VAACASSASARAALIGLNRPWKYSAAAVAVPIEAEPAPTSQNPVTSTPASPMNSAAFSRP